MAYIGSVKETRAVRQWADGERTPSAEVMKRLRYAYHVAALLAEHDARDTVQAWFQGMNPQLDDVPPARLLREGLLGRRSSEGFGRGSRVHGIRLDRAEPRDARGDGEVSCLSGGVSSRTMGLA